MAPGHSQLPRCMHTRDTCDTCDPGPCLLIFGQCLAAAAGSDLDPVTRIWVSARPRHVTRDTGDICFRIFPATIFIPDGTGQYVTEHPARVRSLYTVYTDLTSAQASL